MAADGSRARLVLISAIVVIGVAAVVAGLVWFLSGNPDETRNTSGFSPPTVTQASFCQGVVGFQADVAAADPGAAGTAYVEQVRSAADRLRSSGTPADMPADVAATLTSYLGDLQALPDSATARDVARLRSGGSAGARTQRAALDDYLASECPSLVQ